MVKNVLVRGTPGHCKWHPRVPRHPGWEPLLYLVTFMQNIMCRH